MPIPTIGRIVHYTLTHMDADTINRRRADSRRMMPWYQALRPGAVAHWGNEVETGEVYPAMIVRVWGSNEDAACNLQVFLDGNDTFWATSVSAWTEGQREHGRFRWPSIPALPDLKTARDDAVKDALTRPMELHHGERQDMADGIGPEEPRSR